MVSAEHENNTPPRQGGTDASRNSGANVGEALRAVYRDAVAENIPDEMLDLLNKLA